MIRSGRNEVGWRSRSDLLFQSLAALLLVVFFAGAARAQRRALSAATQPQPERQLNAAVVLVTPFAIEQHGSLSGFSIDLWNAIAARMGIKTTAYNVVPGEDTSAMWDVARSDVRSGQLDVLVTPEFITSARDAEFDFSYPVIDTGLQIMVPATADAAQPPNPFLALLGLLLSTRMLL